MMDTTKVIVSYRHTLCAFHDYFSTFDFKECSEAEVDRAITLLDGVINHVLKRNFTVTEDSFVDKINESSSILARIRVSLNRSSNDSFTFQPFKDADPINTASVEFGLFKTKVEDTHEVLVTDYDVFYRNTPVSDIDNIEAIRHISNLPFHIPMLKSVVITFGDFDISEETSNDGLESFLTEYIYEPAVFLKSPYIELKTVGGLTVNFRLDSIVNSQPVFSYVEEISYASLRLDLSSIILGWDFKDLTKYQDDNFVIYEKPSGEVEMTSFNGTEEEFNLSRLGDNKLLIRVDIISKEKVNLHYLSDDNALVQKTLLPS